MFGLLEVAFAAWTLAAFSIGVLAGMVIRRVVPAIAATLAAYAGLAFATALWLREHYITPLLTSSPNLPGSAWAISGWYTKGGTFAFGAHGNGIASTVSQLCGGPCHGTRVFTRAACLSQHGYTHWTSYQPGQPVLGLPVDRRRLAARAVGAAHRRDRLAGPPPGGLTQPLHATGRPCGGPAGGGGGRESNT